jgi:hypothetical protein
MCHVAPVSGSSPFPPDVPCGTSEWVKSIPIWCTLWRQCLHSHVCIISVCIRIIYIRSHWDPEDMRICWHPHSMTQKNMLSTSIFDESPTLYCVRIGDIRSFTTLSTCFTNRVWRDVVSVCMLLKFSKTVGAKDQRTAGHCSQWGWVEKEKSCYVF